MGNYASTADLIARYESSEDLAYLTDSVDEEAADTAVLDEVIGSAEGEINSYLGERYLIPANVSSDAGLASRLKSLTLNFAQWNLEAGRADFVSESKDKAHDHDLENLEKLAKGELVLPSAATLPSTESEGGGASWGTSGTAVSGTSQRLFDRASQENL